MKLYRVKDWSTHYENNRTRELKSMAWVPVPNSHDGDGYTALVCRPDGPELFGAWIAILQVASRCGNPAGGCDNPAGSCGGRGTLLRGAQKPHDAASISRMTRFPEKLIAKALTVLSSDEVGWLECVEMPIKDEIPQEGAVLPQEGAAIPHPTDEEGKEGKEGKEGNGKNGTERKCTLSGKPDDVQSSAQDKSGKPEKYHPQARTVLHILNESAGKHFREVDANLAIISARFNEGGVTLDGMRAMIARQCARWRGTEYADYLQPATLFAKQKFDGYYAAKDSPIITKGQNGHAGPSASDRVCDDIERLIR